MKTYRMAKGWRIFVYFTAIPMFFIFGSMLFLPFWDDTENTSIMWFLAPLSILMMGVMAGGLYDTIKGSLIIGENKLYKTGFPKRDLAFDEIKGYRQEGYYIFIDPHSKQHKRIFTHIFIERKKELLAWLSANYPDLNELAAQEERDQILNNDKLGSNIEERIEAIQKIKKRANLLNGVAIIAALWMTFFPDPDHYCVFACIAIFIALLVVQKRHRNIIKLNPQNDTPYPSIIFGLLAASFAIALKAMWFNLLQYIWLPSIGLTAVLMTIILWKNGELNFKKPVDYFAIAMLLVFMAAFSYGAIVTLNCTFDTSAPTTYRADVLGKRVSEGKALTHYIELSEWGNQADFNEAMVGLKLYNSLSEDDEVIIHQKSGMLGIDWFEVKPMTSQ